MKKVLLLLFYLVFSSYAAETKKLRAFGAIKGFSQPPFFIWNETADKPSGFDIEVLELIGKELKVEFIYHEIDLTKKWVDIRREVLEKNLVDIVIYAYSITEERKKFVSFSSPYYQTELAGLVLKSSKYKEAKDLKNASVFAPQHTTGFQWADKNIKGKINKIPRDFSGSLEDLITFKIVDAFLGDLENLKDMAKNNNQLRVIKGFEQKESLGIAVQKNNQKLLKKINSALEKIKQSGKLDSLVKKYFK